MVRLHALTILWRAIYQMTLLLIYLLIAIGVSFLCSILEAVLLSITPSYLEKLSHRSDPGRAG